VYGKKESYEISVIRTQASRNANFFFVKREKYLEKNCRAAVRNYYFFEKIFFAAATASRAELGLPENWLRVELWLYSKKIESLKIESSSVGGEKRTEMEGIPVNWDALGKKEIPLKPETRIKIEKLEELVNQHESQLLQNEVLRAKRVIEYLKTGAPAHQKRSLGSCLVENKIPGEKGTAAVLKTVKEWIEKGFVAGPFKEPPLDGFRVNGMIAINKAGSERVGTRRKLVQRQCEHVRSRKGPHGHCENIQLCTPTSWTGGQAG
jgi:hypothetical protein